MTFVKVVEGSGGVTTHNVFSVNFCGNLDMLPHRKTQHIVLVGQAEAITK